MGAAPAQSRRRRPFPRHRLRHPVLPERGRRAGVPRHREFRRPQANNSDAYALAVAELSDRLGGLAPIRAPWPADDFQPSRSERIALQRRLSELGYKMEDFEGHLDFDLRDAVRDQQQKFGMIPDGHPSRAFLSRIGIHSP
jgi:Putative peptidoglycan binding domain